MNRIMSSSRFVLCRAPSMVIARRPITISKTTITQTTVTDNDAAAAALNANPITETFVTSETHKVGVVTQKEVVDADGTVRRETIPPAKWDADLASQSEEIVKAERHEGKRASSMDEMQRKSVQKIEEKERKLSGAKDTAQKEQQ